jgi:CTP synthase (UTP-ammonia lyase)
MDKKKEKMTPERRYELACLILGGVVLGGELGCILRPNEWTVAVIPLLGVCLGMQLLWCAAARLWLCRDKQRLLAKSFTRPVRFALAVPAWAGATWLLYLLRAM